MLYTNIVNMTRPEAGAMDKGNKLALAAALLEIAGKITSAQDNYDKARILDEVGKKFGFDFSQDPNEEKAKAFYRNCALALHPDKFPNDLDAGQKKNMEEAFKILASINEVRQDNGVISAINIVRRNQPATGDLAADIQSAINLEALIQVIENYPNDLTTKSGDRLDKASIVKTMKEFATNENKLAQVASDSFINLLSNLGVTSNYGLRDRFVQLAKEKHAENVFVRDIKLAKTMGEFENIILKYPYPIRYSNGQAVDTQQLVDNMREITSNKANIEAIARGETPQVLANITRQYGLRQKFMDIIIQEEKLKAEQSNAKDPVKMAIKEIDATLFWAISASDRKERWTEPLREKLVAIDKSNASPAEKRKQTEKAVADMYISAMQNPKEGFNAARIAGGILKDVLKVPLPEVSKPQVQNPRAPGPIPQAAPQPQAGRAPSPRRQSQNDIKQDAKQGPSAQQKPPSPPPRAQAQAKQQSDDLVQQVIGKFDEMRLTWAMYGKDNREAWILPLREKLVALDKSAVSQPEKIKQLQQLVSDMYLSAKQDPAGTSAARMAGTVLEQILKVPLPIVQPQAQRPPAQGPIPGPSQEGSNKENNSLAAATIGALERWFLVRNVKQQAADRVDVEKLISELKEIQVRNLPPAVEKAQVINCLDRYPSHFKFNVNHVLESWKATPAEVNKGRPLPKAPIFEKFKGGAGIPDVRAAADPAKKEQNINVDPPDTKKHKPNN